MAKFLGLETMSRDDQMRAGLLGVVLLSLECVLAGLVGGAEFRGWIFHAGAAGLGIWAMVDLDTLPVRAAGSTAVIAVLNEALMLVQMNQSFKYILPPLVLLGVSVWVLERSVTARVSEHTTFVEAASFGIGSNWEDAPSALNLPPPLPPSSFSKNMWAPVISVIGVLMALFSFLEAEWVVGKAFFGLIREEFTYSEIRTLWTEFGAPNLIIEAFVGAAHVLGYVGMSVALVGSASVFIRAFIIDRPWRVVGTAFVGVTAGMHLIVVVGLLAADANITVLTGAWLAPLGLGLATLGFWASTDR